MSSRARLYPLLTLCTLLGCPMPAEPGDATATMDESTSDASSSTGAEESSTGESFPTTLAEEPTSSSSTSDTTGTGDDAELPPAAPSLSIDYSPIKQFDFLWAPVAGAEYYQLLERPYPEIPGWSQLGGDLLEASITLSMPIHLRLAAEYSVRACNQAGCSQSEPVQVDPGVDGAIGYFKASNAEGGDYFGLSLAISADGATMVVGAPFEDSGAHGIDAEQSDNSSVHSGAAYVFVREGDTWKQQAYLKSFNGDVEDRFGEVAISGNGDTIAVGAMYESSAATGIDGDPSDNSGLDSGAVYVFERKGSAWSQTAYIKASNTQSYANFGRRVALSVDGNTLAVGAPNESSAATGVDRNPWKGIIEDSGAAYVYSRNGGSWEQRAYLKASNTGESDNFGSALALSADGTTLAVAAPNEESKSAGINGDQNDNSLESGAVYMFTLEDGAWSQQAYIKASNPGKSDSFGFTVALASDGDTLAVGAPSKDLAATEVDGDQPNGAANAGALYVFSRQGHAWQQEANLKAPNAKEGDYFAGAIALSGDGSILVAGASGEDGDETGSFADPLAQAGNSSGAAYVFTRVAGTWTHRRYLKAPNSHNDCQFGAEVGLTADGTTLVIGTAIEQSSATGIGGDQHALTGAQIGAVYMY
ncbi:FG-GAP repeat protein [Nannocystis sp. RBIL2]|uniref:FG-GAP repeat protein n=1 Tax=Nannocystis sp. RBIL2 TaxID=2996788 RepID=UPI002270AD7E|nr:FG-GAP repeat protein [Nannocystis sp. RBIL2]MCY1070633.1 FG-GAP repeat protein [Nannocystis sp. RBIL2]